MMTADVTDPKAMAREIVALVRKSSRMDENLIAEKHLLFGHIDAALRIEEKITAYGNARAAEMREQIALWYKNEGWLLDEDDVAEAIRALPSENQSK